MMYYGGYGGGYGFDILGAVFHLLWFVVVIVIIVAVIRYVRRGGHWNLCGMKSPLDILKERYAKGEINKEEFAEKKRDLSQ